MKVIVAGGSGLIGRALCTELVQDGHTVVVLSRNPQKVKRLEASIQVVQWDGQTAHGWGNHANSADAIVNLAGMGIADGRWSTSRKEAILSSRVNAGQAVVQAIETATTKPKVLIQASAVGYYGGNRADQKLTEDAGPGSDFLSSVCLEWESSTAAVEAMGVRRPVIRTGIVLSTQGGAWPKIKLPFTFFAGGPLGSGRQWYPWIHMNDEVRAIQFLLQKETAIGAFNLSAPEPQRNKEMAKTIGKVMRRPGFMPAPAFALQTILGEMATILLEGQRAVPKKLIDSGFSFNFPTLEDAVHELIGKRIPAKKIA